MNTQYTMSVRSLSTLLFALAGSAIAAPALAQGGRLPDPPPAPVQTGIERAENLGLFVETYRRAGVPRILVYTETFGGDEEIGTKLNARLEDLFRDPEVTLVDRDASLIANRQQANAMARNDELAAARMLGDSAQADLVLYLRLTPKAGSRSYNASYTLADLRRGTSLGRYAWDLTPDERSGQIDSYRVTDYARAIAKRVVTQYSEAYRFAGAGLERRFTVRVLGEYSDDDLTGLRDALIFTPAVKQGSVVLRSEDQSTGQQMATFDLMAAGDLLELRRDLRRAAMEVSGIEAEVIDSRDGVIDLRLNPLLLSSRERALMGGPETARNRADRDAFRSAYAAAGRPTVAIVINRATFEAEESLAQGAYVGSQGVAVPQTATNIIIGDRGTILGGEGGTLGSGFSERVIDRALREQIDERREQAVLDLRVFENELLARFGRLGVTGKDVSAAQQALVSSAPAQAWTDRDLAFGLGQRAGADVVISGVGRLVRDRVTGNPVRVVVSLRAFRVADGVVLGAATVQRQLSSAGESINQSIDELASEATGKIADQMMTQWLNPAAMMQAPAVQIPVPAPQAQVPIPQDQAQAPAAPATQYTPLPPITPPAVPAPTATEPAPAAPATTPETAPATKPGG